MGRFGELFESLPATAHARGRAFEEVCRWLLQTHPLYKSLVRKVWCWSEWPDAWGRDVGIDLVAATHDDKLWAVQCKADAPEHYIAKREIDSFLAESARSVFAQRLLIATTDLIGTNALQAIHAQGVPVALILRSDLETAPVVWPSSYTDLSAGRVAPHKDPLPHAERAVDEIVKGFGDVTRGQLVMPCGTGKTLISLWSSERLECTRVLIAVPSLALAGQTLREWSAQASEPASYLAVCSDETVGSEDHLFTYTSELGVPVTTDVAEIAGFLAQTPGRQVVVTTYQSARRVAEAMANPHCDDAEFDLLVADEAHRCSGPAAGDFAVVLSDDAIRARRRLFMTATPRYFTGRVRREAAASGLEIASMDQADLFGTPLHRLSFAQAISDRLLTDYVVAVIGVSQHETMSMLDERRLVQLEARAATDAATLASQIGVLKAIGTYKLRRTISFHSRVARAAQFARDVTETAHVLGSESGPGETFAARHVNGTMSASRRRAALGWLADVGNDEYALLTNARCLGEGVDLPALDCVAFIDPKASQVDIIQAVGRALRRAAGKERAVIVIPVFIEDGRDAVPALETSAWAPVWSVLRALRAHDETLAEELDDIRRTIGRRSGSARLPSRIRLDLPETVGFEFVEALKVRLVEQTSDDWLYMFSLVEQFTTREGHARVPHNHVEDGKQLGRWVMSQRRQYLQGKLSADREQMLAGLDGWTWNAQSDVWDRGYQRLLDYVAEHGTCENVRAVFKLPDGFDLGDWVARQRAAYRSGRLDDQQRRRLEGVPGWRWRVSTNKRGAPTLEPGLAALEAFIKREGHSRVPVPHVEDDFPLGKWVQAQRAMTRERVGADVRRRLDAMPGWEWYVVGPTRPSLKTRGGGPDQDKCLALLQQYVVEYGTALVPATTVYHGVRLGPWLNRIKMNHRRGLLREDFAEALEAVPGWSWNPLQEAWENAFACLLAYVERTGTADVPADHVENGFELGDWCRKQRRNFHRLQTERAIRLAALPGWHWWKSGPRKRTGQQAR